MNQETDSTNKTDPWLEDLYNNDNGKKPQSEDEQSSESGGPKGLEPTRYGDWEKSGRCIDF